MATKREKEQQPNSLISSKEIERLTQEFLAKGGKIKKGPTLYAEGAYRGGIVSAGGGRK